MTTEERTESPVNTGTELNPENTGLIISFPFDAGNSGEPITPEAIESLRKLIASKATLIKKALNADQLDVIVEAEKLSFPWWIELPEQSPAGFSEVTAYSEFLAALVKMARKAKRVTATENPVESEKYAFRTLLLRLGFSGSEYKQVRKVLMRRLDGHSAFPTKAAADAFYEKQRGKRESTVEQSEK